MRYFPIFMDISEKPVLVVGGGEVASRKVEALVKANAKVIIVSPTISTTLKSLIECQKCEWIHEKYNKNQLSTDLVQVWATTDDSDLNHKIYHDAHELNLLVNVVDDQPYCDFITPSMINRGRIQLAISSGGSSPVLIRNVRQALEAVLPQNLALLADFAASKRDDIKQRISSVDLRRRFWERFFAQSMVQDATEFAILDQCYQRAFEQTDSLVADCTMIFYGNDAELLPMKATRYMQQSELILYDAFCRDEYIELSRRDAEKSRFNDLSQLKGMLAQAQLEDARVVVFVNVKDRDLYRGCGEINRYFSPAEMN
jgi:precorrin-2 dehydrogenase/sirohydrochlorin ferrochelatase